MLLSAVADRTLRFWHLDWEPEERALPAWDEKARPFLESFVSLRLKPETVRTTAPWTDGEVEALVEQMRHRGFGGLQKEAVVGRLRDLALQDSRPPSFWDEVREAAPRTGPVKVGRAAPEALRKIPWGRVGAAAALVLAVGVAVASWYRPAVKPRLVEHQAELLRTQLYAYDLKPYTSSCDPTASREDLFARVLAPQPEVSAVDLSCVAQLADGALVAPYFDRVVLADADKARESRHLRGAVALLVALGDPAVDAVCDGLGHPRPEVRILAARALAESSSPRARTCLGAGALHPQAAVRAAVLTALPTALARGQVEPGRGSSTSSTPRRRARPRSGCSRTRTPRWRMRRGERPS
jgi:hypothetical protein